MLYYDGSDIVKLDNGTSGQVLKSNGAAAPSWTSSLTLAFRGEDPEILLRDSNAAGADDADEDAGSIKAQMSTTTEDAEVSDMRLTYFDAGTERTWGWWDASDWAWHLGVMTDADAPADVADYERLKIDLNTGVDRQIIIGPGGSTGAGIAIENGAADATDGFYDGLVRTYTVDSGQSNTSLGQAYHIDTDGELIEADADVASAAAMPAVGLGV